MSTTMRIPNKKQDGKLNVPPQIQALADGTRQSRLFIRDRKLNLIYLIDTGADMSVLPKNSIKETCRQDDFKLFAANGSEIKTFREKTIQVDLNLRWSFPWKFTVANVTHAILDADFLRHFKLMVDLANKRLIDGTTNLHVSGHLRNALVPSVTTINKNCRYYHLLKEYIDITKTSPRKEGIHQVQHHIITRGIPVTERARRLPPEKFKVAKAEFDMMVQEGLCQPSSSPWASPLHMVHKKNGGWRLCGDYRSPQRDHHPRQVSSAPHSRFFVLATWMQGIH